MDTRIFLIGFMGSGKSTHGSSLAKKIGYDFIDMDQLIEQTSGMTIPGIFQEHGETTFRKWEYDILLELCARERLVISTGGGAPCHHDLMHIMNRNGCTIYIKLPAAVLKDRLLQSQTRRPLIEEKSASELLDFIQTLLKQREIFYKQANFTVDGVNLNTEMLELLVQ